MSIANKDEYGSILLIAAVVNLVAVIGIFFIFKSYNKSKLNVYSENSEINYIINRE